MTNQHIKQQQEKAITTWEYRNDVVLSDIEKNVMREIIRDVIEGV